MSNDNKLAEVDRAIRLAFKHCGTEDCEHETVDDCLKSHLLPVISRLLDAAKREAFSEAADSADVQEVVVEKLGAISKDAIAGIRDAAHADALRAAAEFLRCKCGMDCGFMDCTVGPNDILALIPERARLQHELEVTRAIVAEVLFWNGWHVCDDEVFGAGIKCEACKRRVTNQQRLADLEAKLAELSYEEKTTNST